jgi:hypothetical protein
MAPQLTLRGHEIVVAVPELLHRYPMLHNHDKEVIYIYIYMHVAMVPGYGTI